MIVTFYSYKGGTGRTMALANIAALLAARGHRVLAVDFDLEAPGLWRYFAAVRKRLDQQPGLIDLLTAASAARGSPDIDWRDYVTQLPLGKVPLSLMTSGQLEEEYASRVLGFGWREFFQDARGGEFFERLRLEWREEYEFTLIDSRTGVTDTGGICTIMLPDMIVPVFVSNLQSIDGAVEVITRAQAARMALAYDRPPAAILPLLSRFEGAVEYENAQEWLDIAADRVEPFYRDWLPVGFGSRRALERTKLPYVPYFSFGEKLPALTEGTSDLGSLGFALNLVSTLIERKLEGAASILGGVAEDADALPEVRSGAEAPVRVFLSYASEDSEIAADMAGRLRDDGFEVFEPWVDAGTRFVEQIGAEIQRADAFLALLSPSYLASPWCRRERDLAILDGDPLYVLKVRDVPRELAGFLASYDWLDVTGPAEQQDDALRVLAGELTARSGGLPTRTARPAGQVFRDREGELDRVLRDLTNEDGSHFWLVTAPPGLGKSWFLSQVAEQLVQMEAWAITVVDLRVEPSGSRRDASALVGRLLGRPSAAPEPGDLLTLARDIAGGGRPLLCMLDSAELLEPGAVTAVRRALGEVDQILRQTGLRTWLALIVASRRAGEWAGVTPPPRLATLPLTEFRVEVVNDALRELAQNTNRSFSAAELRVTAGLVHRVTEGLPVPLMRCLDWIQQEQWIDMYRLAERTTFDQFVGPYIRDTLLAQRTLLPESRGPDNDALTVLQQVVRVLTPHRRITQSHLRYHLDQNPGLSVSPAGRRWTLEELWRAVTPISLFTQPLNEPWQEIQPATRRLLFRYHYSSDPERTEAHSQALAIERLLVGTQAGTEQAVFTVEALWHEATVLSLTDPAAMAARLTESARRLSSILAPTPAYTAQELRRSVQKRIAEDEELQQVLGQADGLLDSILEAVADP
jgi:cellulose biosynthesis protein BcsQ